MYSPREYWARLAELYASKDAAKLAPVMHPDAPYWFNLFIDRLQAKAWRRALNYCDLPRGSLILDVGCGTGRWLRRFSAVGFQTVGVDQTPGMLQLARSTGLQCALVLGRLQDLPFGSTVFDLVSAVTVVQHIPYPEQVGALKEMVRVLRPGGYLLLFELIVGSADHVMPRRPEDWVAEVCRLGCRSLHSAGEEFLPIDRFFVTVVQRARDMSTEDKSQFACAGQASQGVKRLAPLFSRRLYWWTRRILLMASACLEPILEKTSSPYKATHGVFVFQKNC